MENKSKLKYYLIGAVILVAIVIAAIVLSGGPKSAGQAAVQAPEQASLPASLPAPQPAVNTPGAAAPAAPTSNFVGTWTSAVPGKGMQASGNFQISGFAGTVTMTGDVTVVIQRVENNIAYGTLAYSNLCTTATVLAPGKAPVVRQPDCISSQPKAIQLQLSGNTMSFAGPTLVAGGTVTFTGTYSNDSASGTFKRSSSYGELDGTFSLVHSNS